LRGAGGRRPRSQAAPWGLERVPYRSANPLQMRDADCLQVWKSGRVSHEQQDFLQHRYAEQLMVVHLCKTIGGPVLFFYGKHRDGARILCQKGPACSPVFFCLRQAFIVFGVQEMCW